MKFEERSHLHNINVHSEAARADVEMHVSYSNNGTFKGIRWHSHVT